MSSSIKWWVHLLGVLALYGVLAGVAPLVMRVLAWLGVAAYALAWWAGLDELLKRRRGEGAIIPTGVSAAWPVAVVLIVGGAVTAVLRLSTGLGMAALGFAILLAGYFATRAHS